LLVGLFFCGGSLIIEEKYLINLFSTNELLYKELICSDDIVIISVGSFKINY